MIAKRDTQHLTPILGGSWVIISTAISNLNRVKAKVTLLISLHTSAHEPPSATPSSQGADWPDEALRSRWAETLAELDLPRLTKRHARGLRFVKGNVLEIHKFWRVQ